MKTCAKGIKKIRKAPQINLWKWNKTENYAARTEGRGGGGHKKKTSLQYWGSNDQESCKSERKKVRVQDHHLNWVSVSPEQLG